MSYNILLYNNTRAFNFSFIMIWYDSVSINNYVRGFLYKFIKLNFLFFVPNLFFLLMYFIKQNHRFTVIIIIMNIFFYFLTVWYQISYLE